MIGKPKTHSYEPIRLSFNEDEERAIMAFLLDARTDTDDYMLPVIDALESRLVVMQEKAKAGA